MSSRPVSIMLQKDLVSPNPKEGHNPMEGRGI